MMTWRSTNYLISALVLIMIACQSDYTRMVKEELSKGIRKDSILFSINFGDTRQDFYGRCFDLNKQHLVSHGPGNKSVQYLFKDSVVHKTPTDMRLLFFPKFDEKDRIKEMEMELGYVESTLYRNQAKSDSLETRVKDLLVDWYGGNQFVTAKVKDHEFPVKVDGNRRIILEKKEGTVIAIRVQDLLHPAFQHSVTKENASK